MPGPMGRRNRGPAQKVENSGQVLKRLFGIIFKKYKFQMIIVFVCILKRTCKCSGFIVYSESY